MDKFPSSLSEEMKEGIRLQEEREAWEKEQEREKARNNFNGSVKTLLDNMIAFKRQLAEAKDLIEFGKFSPEAKAFTSRKIRALIKDLSNYDELLNGSIDKQ